MNYIIIINGFINYIFLETIPRMVFITFICSNLTNLLAIDNCQNSFY